MPLHTKGPSSQLNSHCLQGLELQFPLPLRKKRKFSVLQEKETEGRFYLVILNSATVTGHFWGWENNIRRNPPRFLWMEYPHFSPVSLVLAATQAFQKPQWMNPLFLNGSFHHSLSHSQVSHFHIETMITGCLIWKSGESYLKTRARYLPPC